MSATHELIEELQDLEFSLAAALRKEDDRMLHQTDSKLTEAFEKLLTHEPKSAGDANAMVKYFVQSMLTEVDPSPRIRKTTDKLITTIDTFLM